MFYSVSPKADPSHFPSLDPFDSAVSVSVSLTNNQNPQNAKQKKVIKD